MLAFLFLILKSDDMVMSVISCRREKKRIFESNKQNQAPDRKITVVVRSFKGTWYTNDLVTSYWGILFTVWHIRSLFQSVSTCESDWSPLSSSDSKCRSHPSSANELVGAANPPCKPSRESLIRNLAASWNVKTVKLMFSRISGRDERLQSASLKPLG